MNTFNVPKRTSIRNALYSFRSRFTHYYNKLINCEYKKSPLSNDKRLFNVLINATSLQLLFAYILLYHLIHELYKLQSGNL